jgi:hypothetical protein
VNAKGSDPDLNKLERWAAIEFVVIYKDHDVRDQSRGQRSVGEDLRVSAQKTMYGGKHVAKGDTIFIFASENEGGPGLIASGVITSAKAIAKKRGIVRQTPRVSIIIRRTALAKRRLGRGELKPFSDWNDGRHGTELNFKFYRQATNKIVGISDEAAAFLRGFF